MDMDKQKKWLTASFEEQHLIVNKAYVKMLNKIRTRITYKSYTKIKEKN